MSNFSDIGFGIANDMEAYMHLLESVYPHARTVRVKNGAYSVYTDESGAELWLQFDKDNSCMGANPHYNGKSRRRVCLTTGIAGTETTLDGSLHAWADPLEPNNPESGAYPFVFDVPDFLAMDAIDFPCDCHIQLSAFAHEIDIYANEDEFTDGQPGEIKFAAQSFIPSGLFAPPDDKNTLASDSFFTGIIKDFERKTNQHTKQDFYWLLVDTLGGEVDVLADPRLVVIEPARGGILQGSFWLSGRPIDIPRKTKQGAGFFQRLFGR